MKNRRIYSSLNECLSDYRNEIISKKSCVIKIKNSDILLNEVFEKTKFLNEYNVEINERIYCILNDITEIVKCKYCGNKATFDRINTGYNDICKDNICLKTKLREVHIGNNIVSTRNRDMLHEWENSIIDLSQLSDVIITKHIKSHRVLKSITNEIIKMYLNNRYTDSDSLWESWHRITHTKIENKPKCNNPGCNNTVTYYGRKNMMFAECCSHTCSNVLSKIKKNRKI